jgi:RNA polymerase sigma-70 factor (ECF subfamily)
MAMVDMISSSRVRAGSQTQGFFEFLTIPKRRSRPHARGMSSSPLSAEHLGPLVARARAGDRKALEAVLQAIAPSIHRFGLRMCKSVHDAEDVLQDTLINIATHLAEFEGRSSLSSWVFALTRSACARKRRGLKNRPPVSDERLVEAPDLAASPESKAADQQLAMALSRALDDLSDDYREVILLRDVEGLSAPEAASSLGISVDALKSRLHRAREALRTTLRPLLEPSTLPGRGCPDVVELWSQMLEGDLSQDDCSAMQKHLAGCPSCSAACDALKKALVACQRVRTDEVPPEIQARVKAAVKAWASQGSLGRSPA